MTQADLLNALRDCFEPALKCNIVDLGLVIDAQLFKDDEAPGAGIPGVPVKYHATVQLMPSSNDEIATAQMVAQIQNRLAGLQQISETKVVLDETQFWTPERITPEGRRLLGLDRPARGGLIQIKLP